MNIEKNTALERIRSHVADLAIQLKRADDRDLDEIPVSTGQAAGLHSLLNTLEEGLYEWMPDAWRGHEMLEVYRRAAQESAARLGRDLFLLYHDDVQTFTIYDPPLMPLEALLGWSIVGVFLADGRVEYAPRITVARSPGLTQIRAELVDRQAIADTQGLDPDHIVRIDAKHQPVSIYVSGAYAYQAYAAAMNAQNVGVAAWDALEDDDKAAWQAVANEVIDFAGELYGTGRVNEQAETVDAEQPDPAACDELPDQQACADLLSYLAAFFRSEGGLELARLAEVVDDRREWADDRADLLAASVRILRTLSTVPVPGRGIEIRPQSDLPAELNLLKHPERKLVIEALKTLAASLDGDDQHEPAAKLAAAADTLARVVA